MTHASLLKKRRLIPIFAALLWNSIGAAAELGSDIRRSVSTSGLGELVSYSVVDVGTGQTIASGGDFTLRKPASNMKLLTTGAALESLGPEFKFRTQLKVDSNLGLARMVVAGGGDPGFADPELLARMSFIDDAGKARPGLGTQDLLQWWIDAAVKAGITRVAELVVDDRVFDRVCYNPAWPTDQRTRPYCAEIWGFNFHANMMFVRARTSDTKVVIDGLEPSFDWTIARNGATVGPAKSKSSFVVTRNAESHDLVVSGRLPAGARVELDLSIHNPPALFGELLSRGLRARGITVDSVRLATGADPAATGTVLGVIETPLAVVLARANTDSNNLHAEALLKRLGAAHANAPTAIPGPGYIGGSWENGASALRESLERRVGADSAAFVLSYGCGLSHANRVTAAGMTAWLRSFAADDRLGSAFLASLAIAGENGTVQKRFAELAGSPVSVRCKTGYINGVSCLSGVVIAPSGRKIAFSVLTNGIEKIGTDRPKKLQEALVMDIVRALSIPNGRP